MPDHPRTADQSGRALFDPAQPATGLVLLLALALLFVVDPAVTRIWPECPFLALTGWLCPLCGSLRGVHAALHGQFLAALQCNALTSLAALVVMAQLASRAVGGRIGTRSGPAPRGRARLGWMVAGTAALLFTVARNVPGGAFAWLRP